MRGESKVLLGGRFFLPGEGNKEYEIRTKIEQEQWLVVVGSYLENCYLV